jgi:hypothetical protein
VSKRKKIVRKAIKVLFYQSKIHYLGHIVSGEGITVDPMKVDSIMEWPSPKNVQEVCIFIGLA